MGMRELEHLISPREKPFKGVDKVPLVLLRARKFLGRFEGSGFRGGLTLQVAFHAFGAFGFFCVWDLEGLSHKLVEF